MAPLLSEEEAALDPYALLGITTDASEKDVRRAYKFQSLKYHPDKVSRRRRPFPLMSILN